MIQYSKTFTLQVQMLWNEVGIVVLIKSSPNISRMWSKNKLYLHIKIMKSSFIKHILTIKYLIYL